jgi:hypothetical protein
MAEPEQSPAGDQKPFDTLVSEAAVHAKERLDAQAAPTAPPPPKSRTPLLAILSIVFLCVAGWNVYYFVYSGSPSPAFEEAALQASIFLAQQSIEAELAETGDFPASLEEVGADEEGLSYVVTGEVYTLTAQGNHHAINFQRGDDLTPFEAAFRALLAGEVTS